MIEDTAAMFTKASIKLALSFSDVLFSAFFTLDKVYIYICREVRDVI